MVHHLSLGGAGWRDAIIPDRVMKTAIESSSKPFCTVSASIREMLDLSILVASLAGGG
jgi:hypothetical protein